MKASLINGKELGLYLAPREASNVNSILTSDLEEVFSLELL